jgi:hypothetical protein
VRVAKALGRDPGSEPFTIALASREPLPATTGGVLLSALADAALGAELERARADIATLRLVEAGLRNDAATLLGELDDKRSELRSVYASVSWRLTEPLRRAKRLRRR